MGIRIETSDPGLFETRYSNQKAINRELEKSACSDGRSSGRRVNY